MQINFKELIEANIDYYKDKFFHMPIYLKEQTLYRLDKCKYDCLVTGKCKHCGCPTKVKVWAHTSCNKGERFPDLMTYLEWQEFKKINNITIKNE